MEFKIARDELTKALYRAQGIVERKTTMPILSNVLLEASRENGLVVSAFDTEIGLQSKARCEILKDGSLALPGRYFYDIVKVLPDPFVHVKRTPNGQVELVSGNARFKIVSTPAKDFPPLPSAPGAAYFPFAGDELLLMIERTQFAISTDETRYNLGGVFLEQTEGGAIRMVATDGHRLSMIERKLDSPIKLERGIILPKKGLMELRRLLADDGGPCELALTPGSAVLRREGVLMIIRLLEGVFPDYRQVIPKESSRTLILKRPALIETLRRVSLVAQDKASGVKLEVGDGSLTISSQNPDLGEAQEQIEAKVTGAPLKVGFNARYLIDVLTVLTADEIQLDLLDDLSPGLLKPVGETGYLAVVMPMRI